MLSDCLSEAVRATDAYCGVAYLMSPDHRTLVLAKVAGLAVSLLDPWRRIPVNGAFPTAAAIRTGRTVFLADAGETMRRFPQLAIGMPYAFASASAPVRAGPEAVAVICVMWPASPGRGLPVTRRRGLRAATRRLGAALERHARDGVPLEYAGPPTATPLDMPVFTPNRVGTFDWNLTTGMIAADEELYTLFGLDRRTFDGRVATLAAQVVPDGERQFRDAARRATQAGLVTGWRIQVRWPDGSRHPLEIWGRVPDPARGGDKNGLTSRHLVGIALDLGMSAAAAEAVERLRDGVFSLDPDGRITYANVNLQAMLDIRLEDVLGRTPWAALPWLADPSYEDRYRAAMLSQEPTSFLSRAPGDVWLAFSLYPDPYGLTGTVVPTTPPSGAAAAQVESPPVSWPAAGPARLPSRGASVESVGAAGAPPRAPKPAPPRLGAIYHVLQMAAALTEAVTVDHVCEVVADQLVPAFDGQELAIYVVQQDKRFHLARQIGYPSGFLDPFEGVPLDSHLPGVETLLLGTPMFFESPGELARAYPGIPMDEMASWAFLPLIASDRPVGSCILGFRARHRFSPEERSVLTALSGLVAQALERARLYDAEFTLARGLQHALLPHRLPTLPHLEIAARYLPGTQGMEIGGDWYDVIDTGHDVALVIGDVEGHSVAAAATMGQLRSAVRAFATAGNSPEQVLRATNQLLADLDSGLFASCCYIVLDPATGIARAARAGHPQPMLRDPDGTARVLEVAGGTLLGVDREAAYPVTEVTLSPGSVLALYTDGLVEDVGIDIDQGVERLRGSLARGSRPAATIAELADRMVHDAGRLVERADDVALLLTLWKGGDAPASEPGPETTTTP
ncbi:SpoIIE family protein phosphatase [Yinghuangia seranimata]|uniref:SpoIIE family protein phosphatase n=1 Tax=Yinghuangia seranimata TaxID=408067 RepID=UPI00248B9FC4|nr:SpoIIE family protein phosphatase [Yinghuangia seranimata]